MTSKPLSSFILLLLLGLILLPGTTWASPAGEITKALELEVEKPGTTTLTLHMGSEKKISLEGLTGVDVMKAGDNAAAIFLYYVEGDTKRQMVITSALANYYFIDMDKSSGSWKYDIHIHFGG